MNDIAKCVGGEMKHETFQYQTKQVKLHGSGTDLLAAVRKPAHLSPLSEPADVSYAQQHLDAQLMNIFHYKVEVRRDDVYAVFVAGGRGISSHL